MPDREPSRAGADDGSDDARKRRRRQIVAAAIEVFAERGYHKASVSDIIERAGIARGTFYLYFAGKHNILESILDGAVEELEARITRVEVGPDAPPPAVQLKDNLVRILEYVLADRDLTQLLFNHGLSPEDSVVERIDAFYDDVAGLLQSSLEQGVEMGLVRSCDLGLAAAAILGAVRGVVARLVASATSPDLSHVADELIAFSLRGVIDARHWSE